jgi:hypothetical protein
MKLKHLIPALLVALAAAVLPAAGLAQGQTDPNAKANFIGKIVRTGDTASLRVHYRCSTGDALWVSAKQVASRRRTAALKEEGSSKVSAAWWQSHRNPFVCNGRYHTARVTIDKVEPGSKGKLKKGKAWVQFCVTKNEKALILSKSGWVGVRVRSEPTSSAATSAGSRPVTSISSAPASLRSQVSWRLTRLRVRRLRASTSPRRSSSKPSALRAVSDAPAACAARTSCTAPAATIASTRSSVRA